MLVRYRGRGTGLRLDDQDDGPRGWRQHRALDCGRSNLPRTVFRFCVMGANDSGGVLDLNEAETLLLIEAALATLAPRPAPSGSEAHT
jgi:hypothetical protein